MSGDIARHADILFATARAHTDKPVLELRALGVGDRGDVHFGFFDDPKKLAAAAAKLSAEGIYTTLNPVNPALLARAANRVKRAARKGGSAGDGDIARRLFLLVDADAKRPAGISSTDTEHDAALLRVDQIRAHLVAAGWPAPILADSGNGGHALYRIDLPNDDAARDLVKHALEALAARFSDERVTVDTTVFNAARISKLYGTLTAKGDPLPDRPHRHAALVEVPNTLGVVPRELLEALAAEAKKPPAAKQRSRSSTTSRGTFDLLAWLERRNIKVGEEQPHEGGWLRELVACPFSSEHTAGAFVGMTAAGAVYVKCQHQTCGGLARNRWLDLRDKYESERPKGKRSAGSPSMGDGEQQARPLRSRSYLSIFTILRDNFGDVLDGRKLEFDELAQAPTLARRPVTDDDLSALRADIERKFPADEEGTKGLQFAIADVAAAVNQVAASRPFHSVRDYLTGLRWDERGRLAELPARVGAEAPLAGMLLGKTLIAAVARAMQPGCKVDTVLVLIGPQGIGKSRLFATLAGRDFFSDSHIDIGAKDGYQVLRGRWIVEMAELEALRRARDAESIKAFFSSAVDHYRDSYARLARSFPRSCIIVGSTNDGEFLTDPTGGRRFWPVVVSRIDLAWVEQHRDQLWAEATMAWRDGEHWWLTAEEERQLGLAQVEHRVRHPWTPLVLDYLMGKMETTSSDVLTDAVKKPPGQWTRGDEMAVASILRAAGWEQEKRHRGPRVWRAATFPGEDAAEVAAPPAEVAADGCPPAECDNVPHGAPANGAATSAPARRPGANLAATSAPVGGGNRGNLNTDLYISLSGEVYAREGEVSAHVSAERLPRLPRPDLPPFSTLFNLDDDAYFAAPTDRDAGGEPPAHSTAEPAPDEGRHEDG